MRGFTLLELALMLVILGLIFSTLNRNTPCPEHGVLIRQTYIEEVGGYLYSATRDCAVLQHVDGKQEWQCDDGCWYKGMWQSAIETNLLCPEDRNDDR